MTEKEYRSAKGISRSELWKIRESPEKFKWFQEHPEQPSPALIFGQVVHKLLLQPESFDEEYCVAPNVDRRTKTGKVAWQEFEDFAIGKTIVSDEFFSSAKDMVAAAYNSPFVLKLLAGEKEKPFFWTDDLTGEPCKIRVDCLTEIGGELIIVDYKSTANAATEAFMRSAINYGYDFQAAMYSEGVKKCTGRNPKFVFIAQEKDPPYSVNIMQADDLLIRRGYDVFRELLGIYHDCKQSGNWYGYLGKYNMLNNLCLPAWLAAEVE